MSNIAETYRKVCEKRAEAAYIKRVTYAGDPNFDEPDADVDYKLIYEYGEWVLDSETHRFGAFPFFSEEVAEALIVSHWLTLFPVETALTHDSDGEWVIFDLDSKPTDPGHKTPFDALAAYLLGGGE